MVLPHEDAEPVEGSKTICPISIMKTFLVCSVDLRKMFPEAVSRVKQIEAQFKKIQSRAINKWVCYFQDFASRAHTALS